MQNLLKNLANLLVETVDDLANLEIKTYTSDQLEMVTYEAGEANGAMLQAFTRVSIDGDVLSLVPAAPGQEIDWQLWETHRDMVQLAYTHQLEFIKAVGYVSNVKLLRLH
jgi:hypothetical protein